MKTDLKKTEPGYTGKRGVFEILEIPPRQYLMVDGTGDPNTSAEFGDAIAALYPIAYALKFASKNELGRDYVVMPLEGQWWAEDYASFTSQRDKSTWRWALMVLVPNWTTPEMVDLARKVSSRKKPDVNFDSVRFETLVEGLSVQTLHIGSFDEEAPILHRMHSEFIPGNGLRLTGKHHEIYLSDPRKSAPEKRRTILRQPVERQRENA